MALWKWDIFPMALAMISGLEVYIYNELDDFHKVMQ